ncbi:Putative FAD linked oxidase, FAD-binding, type PCMH, subdomain 2 [Septoria linicola]|uniref:FAD linked oxidase, FAD-binding, type PCMH, subdomain 2 n=1 Tax=Septoria linicola TaxID=215465 RepID=A0A9Q9EHU4_9PEZI|nr:Putative FAD linked oxidase, FAD-binding, type PCMH, subdomain 2 [Septoria linicola]
MQTGHLAFFTPLCRNPLAQLFSPITRAFHLIQTHIFRRRACQLGGLPSYIVNATSPEQVATAAKWAAERNIRIVIKGTGHDLSMEGQAGLTLCLSGHAIFATFDVKPSGKYLGVTTPRM